MAGAVRRFLNRPGRIGRAWAVAYDAGYATFRAVVMFGFTPFIRVRSLTPHPDLRPNERVIYCPNHESYLDPAFVQLVVPRRTTFVMTNDFYRQPGMRWFFALVGAIPMQAGRGALAGLRRAIAAVRRRHPVCLFPEGRLSTNGKRWPGQRGIAVVARRTGAMIVPVGILGSRRAWPRGQRRPRAANVRLGFGEPMVWQDPAPGVRPRDAERAFVTELMSRIEGVIHFLETGSSRRASSERTEAEHARL